MKRLLVIAAMLLGACAPEVPHVAETSGGEVEGAAGSVAVKAEALLEPTNACNRTLSNWETIARGKLGVASGTQSGWQWTGALNGTWTGTNQLVGGTFKCFVQQQDTLNRVYRHCTLQYPNKPQEVVDWQCTTLSIPPSVVPQEYCNWNGTRKYTLNPCN